jgi:hypothetical protein
LAAAMTASVLGFGFSAVDASAHGKWHQPMSLHIMHKHCKMMKAWHHGHAMWVKKCW